MNTSKEIYSNILINRELILPIINIGKNTKVAIEKLLSLQIEGRCVVEGYIKPRSTKLISYSSGIVIGSDISFQVVAECQTCNPVEGMIINCKAKNITKAGIKAEIDDEYNPLIIFIARDHHYNLPYFSEVKENDIIMIKIIGQRYELYDKNISVIAELIEPEKMKKGMDKKKKKPKLIIKDV
jgi:hypothetical protein